ncbi:peptidase S8/S53 domain-containing protein [Parachaetomium inaequale]|uniref:Peptidase S8/S53 domain-containing protein n=1 Tax=Parachaetomium inaequale TaxID=2588326 RepID=A0AAN6SP18_9PEZI|nr:peptidase S8/S53 domain-containing protein [Parachaetomium inaequale]
MAPRLNGNDFTFDSVSQQRPPGGQLEEGKNYIVIHLHNTLNRTQKQKLQSHGVVLQKHLGDNTWKCRYEPSDIGRIINEEFVKDAIPEPIELKVQPGLDTNADGRQTVDVVLQEQADQSAEQIGTLIHGITGVPTDSMSARRDNTIIRVEVPLSQLREIASIDSVASIEKVVDVELHNNVARGILNADVVVNATAYRGDEEIVTVADTGFDTGSRFNTHPAFAGRVLSLLPVGRPTATNDEVGHGTHVCGSVLGDGVSNAMGGPIQGTAPEARLIVQALSSADKVLFKGSTMTMADLLQNAHDQGSHVHTNSWGPRWENEQTGQVFGQQAYHNGAVDIDAFAWDHKDMVICFSAGNNGGKTLNPGDLGQVGAQAAAKNCITVGSCASHRPTADASNSTVFNANGPQEGDPATVSRFSSRGPSRESRAKPDVIAPGGMILSTHSRDAPANNSYGVSLDPDWWWCSGTSMATPLVAGCAAVLRQVLRMNGFADPSAALVKALLVNGATDLGRQWHRSEQGFGRVDLAGSVVVPGQTPHKGFLEGQILDQNGRDEVATGFLLGQYLAQDRDVGTLKTTMVYTDLPGEALQHLVSLSVEVVDEQGGKTVRYGNAGDGEQKRDNVNTVEQVVWKDIRRACNVTLRVSLDGVLIPDDAVQPFALVWSVL